jgi:FkbM family methyltransferase
LKQFITFTRLKNSIKYLLQRTLGFRNYLYVFAWYKVKTLKRDSKENDFFAFLDLLPDDGIVLDIGANIGIMTVHLAKHVRKGNVVAFEPVPDNLETLRKVIARFGLRNVRVEACALGSEEGKVKMVMPVENGARQQGLSHVLHETITERNEGLTFTVPLHMLDNFDFARSTSQKITGIKMDVENFESFVLEGAKKLLALHQPVLYIELWDNENRQQCFEIVRSLGYEIFVHEGNGRLAKFDPTKHFKQNFIFKTA